jgi:dTDP-4-amino-4,6-dideoxygalactose transaminase
VPVIEDAAQAFGASRGGEPVGALGAAGCFSFFPTKNLGGLGDAGLVASNDMELVRRVLSLRSHGQATPGVFTAIGGNFRIDALHAALLAARLPSVATSLSRRRAIAARYVERLRAVIPGAFEPLRAEDGATFNQFVVRVADGLDRDAVHASASRLGVGTQIYYPRALPDQPCFAAFEPGGEFPVARAAARTTLALPCYPELDDAEIDEVVAVLAKSAS